LACAAPEPAPASDDLDFGAMNDDLALVEERLAKVEDSLGHLEGEVAAASAVNEFTELEIDDVQWPAPDSSDAAAHDASRRLWCHLSEWRGFGKMTRFTRLADSTFYLEAEGHRTLTAHMGTGGVSNEDGSLRFVVLHSMADLEPGVAYHLRPRNGAQRYRWSVASDVVVPAW
jgi:hypothetical protein